jgi:L-aspartate oxidase
LITEALRGEGATLELPDGSRFMPRFDSREELAPRDIVARAIDHEMKRLGCDCVYLNITHKPAEFIKEHFPTIYTRCLEFGIDITRDRIPVVPAAHYTCGGVVVNQRGMTDIMNLYAIGETSFTGLHGANRMASNSLLECFVIAFAAAQDIANRFEATPLEVDLPAWDASRVVDSDDEILVSHNWDELRRCMWDFVGIVRNDERLIRAKKRINLLQEEVIDYYRRHRVTNDLLELRNLVLVSSLIIDSALSRKESRGLHFTLDYPDLAAQAADTHLSPAFPAFPARCRKIGCVSLVREVEIAAKKACIAATQAARPESQNNWAPIFFDTVKSKNDQKLAAAHKTRHCRLEDALYPIPPTACPAA